MTEHNLYVAAAFSLSMLDRTAQLIPGAARVPEPIEMVDAQAEIAEHMEAEWPVVSVIGHEDTAAVLSALLGVDLPASRQAIVLRGQDRLIVGQLMASDGGPCRLPAGATTLPPDARIEWWLI